MQEITTTMCMRESRLGGTRWLLALAFVQSRRFPHRNTQATRFFARWADLAL